MMCKILSWYLLVWDDECSVLLFFVPMYWIRLCDSQRLVFHSKVDRFEQVFNTGAVSLKS